MYLFELNSSFICLSFSGFPSLSVWLQIQYAYNGPIVNSPGRVHTIAVCSEECLNMHEIKMSICDLNCEEMAERVQLEEEEDDAIQKADGDTKGV